MLPVLLQIGPLKLHTYGVMVVLGFLVAVNLAQRHGKRIGYNEDLIGDLAFYMMIAGLVGARTLHIIVYWNTGGYAEDPLKIIRIWEGESSSTVDFLRLSLLLILHKKASTQSLGPW